MQNFMKMTRAYILADKYIMTSFRKDILSFLSKICQECEPLSAYIPALKLLYSKGSAECDLKKTSVGHLTPIMKSQIISGEKSLFAILPNLEFCKDFFALISLHPEIANSILCGLLQHGTHLQAEKKSTDSNGTRNLPQQTCKRQRSD